MDAEDGLPLQSLVIHRMGKFILESYRGYVEENKMPNIYAKFMSTSNESGVFEMMGKHSLRCFLRRAKVTEGSNIQLPQAISKKHIQ